MLNVHSDLIPIPNYTSTHILAGDGDGGPGFDDPSLHDDPQHDGVFGVEDAVGQDSQLAGEHCNVLKLLPLLIMKLLQRGKGNNEAPRSTSEAIQKSPVIRKFLVIQNPPSYKNSLVIQKSSGHTKIPHHTQIPRSYENPPVI